MAINTAFMKINRLFVKINRPFMKKNRAFVKMKGAKCFNVSCFMFHFAPNFGGGNLSSDDYLRCLHFVENNADNTLSAKSIE